MTGGGEKKSGGTECKERGETGAVPGRGKDRFLGRGGRMGKSFTSKGEGLRQFL